MSGNAFDMTSNSNSSQSDLNGTSSLGSPVSSSSNIRGKIKEIQKTLHSHYQQIDDSNVEIKRVRQMMDPLRLSMKRYTDNVHENINTAIQGVIDNQGKQNQRIDDNIDQVIEENNRLKQTIFQMQQQMDNMANSIAQLQGQVFGNYDSDSDAIESSQTLNNKINKKSTTPATQKSVDRQ